MTKAELSVSLWIILWEILTDSIGSLQGLANWKKFFAEHPKYVKVGRVGHPPIDPDSPIPEHCDPKQAKADQEAEAAKKRKQLERGEL